MSVADWCGVVVAVCAAIGSISFIVSKVVTGAVGRANVDHRLADGDSHFADVDKRFDDLDGKVDGLVTAFAAFENVPDRLDELAGQNDRANEWHGVHEHNDDERFEVVKEWSSQFVEFKPMRAPSLQALRGAG